MFDVHSFTKQINREQFEVELCKILKTFIMKNLFFGLIAICVFGVSNAQSKFVKMELPKAWQSSEVASETVIEDVKFKSKSGREMQGQIRFTIPEKGNGLIKLEFSENILLDGGVKTNHLVTANTDSSEPNEGLGDCVSKCHAKFTDTNGVKIPGRGACKAECWMTAIVKAVKTII